MTAELPACEVVCCGHAVHDALAKAAGAVEYVPATHAPHITSPDTVLNVPGPHARHCNLMSSDTESSSGSNPLLQVQFVMLVLAAGDVLLLGHAEQVVWAETEANVPGGHASQGMLLQSALKVPGPQTAHTLLPLEPLYPSTHRHDTLPVSTVPEFAGHTRQGEEPVRLLCW